MILYANGDSHTAAAEAVNNCCFAMDDPRYTHMGRVAHPENLLVSFAVHVARDLNMNTMCEAESASCNDRIIRTTKKYLSREGDPDFILIGWSTWERTEWLHDGVYYQISSSGPGKDWPAELQERYKDWVSSLDYRLAVQEQHEKIWDFHHSIRSIPHLFFNTYLPFAGVEQRDWGNSYIYPYDTNFTYYNWLLASDFNTVNPGSYHFGPEAHRAWADFLLLRLTNQKKESIIVT